MKVIRVWASARYFETLGIRVLHGRAPGYDDPDAVAVNRAFAVRYFEDSSAVGGTLQGKSRIVGVVADVRHLNPRDVPPPIVYQGAADYKGFLDTLAIRSTLPATDAAKAACEAILGIVPGMPIEPRPRTVAGHLDRALALETLMARLVGAFGVIATLLTMLGLYGVVSRAVGTRRAEIGLRMAVGATNGSIRALVFGRSAFLLAGGAGLGLFGAYAAGRLASGMLYEVRMLEWDVVG